VRVGRSVSFFYILHYIHFFLFFLYNSIMHGFDDNMHHGECSICFEWKQLGFMDCDAFHWCCVSCFIGLRNAQGPQGLRCHLCRATGGGVSSFHFHIKLEADQPIPATKHVIFPARVEVVEVADVIVIDDDEDEDNEAEDDDDDDDHDDDYIDYVYDDSV
jgi:hypothetical protein